MYTVQMYYHPTNRETKQTVLPDDQWQEHSVADVADGALLQHVPHLGDE